MAFHIWGFFNGIFLPTVFMSGINMLASLSRPPAELSLIPQDGLAETPLADPLTELRNLAGFSGTFKTQTPKESLNF